MKMYDIQELIHCNPTAVIQFMTTSSYRDWPFTYCCKVKELYDDWMDEANCCPENGDMVLMCTFYVNGIAYPIESTGLDECNDFENLMMQIQKGLKIWL